MSQRVRLQTHVCADPSTHRVSVYQPLHEADAEQADLIYVCGRCDAALVVEGRGMLVPGTVYRCGGCGTDNISPSD